MTLWWLGRDLSAVIDGMVKDATFACISDRTLEHLAPSDRVIVVTRRCLLDATQALHDNGVSRRSSMTRASPPALRSGDLIAPEDDQPRLQAYEQAIRQALHSSMLWAAE